MWPSVILFHFSTANWISRVGITLRDTIFTTTAFLGAVREICSEARIFFTGDNFLGFCFTAALGFSHRQPPFVAPPCATRSRHRARCRAHTRATRNYTSPCANQDGAHTIAPQHPLTHQPGTTDRVIRDTDVGPTCGVRDASPVVTTAMAAALPWPRMIPPRRTPMTTEDRNHYSQILLKS